MSKSGIIKGTLILTIAGIIVKIIGFYNRIFLTRIIGVYEIGVYQLIFPVYILAFSICCQGFQIALTKLVSHYDGLNNKRNAKVLLHYVLIISTFLSIIISCSIYLNSDYLALHFLKNSECSLLLKIMSPAIIFVAIKGAVNGYFLGIKKTGFNAISLVVEQIFRLLITFFLGISLSTSSKTSILAVIALTFSEGIACLVTLIIYFVSESRVNIVKDKNDKFLNKKLIKKLLGDSIPLTLNKSALTLLCSIEAVIIPAMLYLYYKDKTISIELFGIINGVVIPFILFPATLTNSLSTVLLPEVSYAKAKGNISLLKKAFNGSLFFCMIIGLFSSLVFFIFGKWMGEYIFGSKDSGIILQQMAFLCPLIYTSTTMSSILNGIDNVVMNLIYHIISIAIRICFIIIAIPVCGISGYIYGMATSYIFLTAAILINIYILIRKNSISSHTEYSDIHNN